MPSGGQKDVEPPKVLMSNPSNKATNFRGKQFEMKFDEYVVTQSLSSELVISPPLNSDPSIKMTSKTVVISWEDTLAENATYLFQFGEGIKDLNEGNALDSNVFVFSTGDYIDSFSLTGKVVDAFTLKPIEGALVMFYKEDIDSLPLTRNPDYFSKSDKDGLFEVNYVAGRRYKAFVLKPVNKGFIYDLPSEAMAFSDSLISSVYAADSIPLDDSSIVFKLFIQQDTNQYLKSYSQFDYQGINISFNLPVSEFKLKTFGNEDISSWIEVWNETADSVVYWFRDQNEYDSLKLELAYDGSVDTLFFRKPSSPKTSRGKAKKPETLVFDKNFESKLVSSMPLVLSSKKPLGYNALDSAALINKRDTILLKDYLTISDFSISIDYPWEKGESYDVYFPDSSVVDLYGLKVDSSHVKFGVLKDEDLGNLVIDLQFDKGYTYICDLLDKSGNIVKSMIVNADSSLNFEQLISGSYQLRVIFDENSNGKWDSGDYLLKRQPERVVFYEQIIEVKGNWTTEIEWIFRGND